MPGKFTDGYTKSAQKQKFVRHRDLKMKDSELRRESKIQQLMCEGICGRCRDKVQWRFKFDKYKPLKNPATCQDCRQKTIVKAYRTLCDSCASAKNVCPSCCTDLALADTIAKEADVEEEEKVTVDIGDEEMVLEKGASPEAEESKEAKPVNAEEGISSSDLAYEEMPTMVEDDILEDDIPSSALTGLAWNEQKFRNISASKYSKHRATGQEA
eukprot:gene6786-7497_t